MKVFMINPNNERFEAEIVRYFQNVNDKYVIYTLDEKDSNGFQVVYATKIVNDGGVHIGKTITDENEWVLVKNFIKETVGQNKNNQPLTIQDANPVELSELKIESVRPFKLQVAVVEMFARNKKNFEIVQNLTEKVPSKVEIDKEQVLESRFVGQSKEAAAEQIVGDYDKNVESGVIGEMPSSVEVSPVEKNTSESFNEENGVNANDYKKLYEQEVSKNKELASQLETLMYDYVTLKVKTDQIKELLG